MPQRHVFARCPIRTVGIRVVWAATLVFAAIATDERGQAEELLSPSRVAELRAVAAAVVSPDGQLVACTLSVPRKLLEEDDGSAWTELHVVDANGKSRPFVTGKVNVSGIGWMPDGRSVVFVAKRNEDAHAALYAIPIDGGEARRLVKLDSDVSAPTFSPDGKMVALLAQEPLSKERQEYRDKGFNPEIYEEDARPTKVWIAAVDGSQKPRSLNLTGSASYVEWSPTARQLLVVLAPRPLVDDSYMFKRIHIVDVDTGKELDRIDNPGKLGQVSWSPDGKHVAMIAGVDANDPADGHLMVAPVPGGGAPRDLMPDYQAHVNSFAWKDAETLVWIADEGTGTTLGEIGLQGPPRVRSNGPGPVLGGLSLSDNGQVMAATGSAPEHPPEAYLIPNAESAAKRLTSSNPWLKDIRLARQEVVKWKAADGLELEGVLVYPVNYEEGRRYPLILSVHGGPEAHVSNGWVTSYSQPGQTAAARGFAVFYPNYRGSTGRGVEFAKMGQADAAGKEFQDLVDAVDHLAAIGLVDKTKVGITGGSYGGYAAAWGATYYSERFAASVMFVGISDNVSKLGTTDIPEEMYLVHHRKRLWEDWDYFLERSPIRHVEKGQTPTLILHGKVDPRVHPSQSLELYRHLKTIGKAPVRLILYPGEGHGNRRAAARFDYNVRMLRWMEHYLQGPGGDPPSAEIDYAAEMGKK